MHTDFSALQIQEEQAKTYLSIRGEQDSAQDHAKGASPFHRHCKSSACALVVCFLRVGLLCANLLLPGVHLVLVHRVGLRTQRYSHAVGYILLLENHPRPGLELTSWRNFRALEQQSAA